MACLRDFLKNSRCSPGREWVLNSLLKLGKGESDEKWHPTSQVGSLPATSSHGHWKGTTIGVHSIENLITTWIIKSYLNVVAKSKAVAEKKKLFSSSEDELEISAADILTPQKPRRGRRGKHWLWRQNSNQNVFYYIELVFTTYTSLSARIILRIFTV